MTEYKYNNAVIRVHGSEPKQVKEATEKFVKRILIQKRERKREML